MGQKQINAPSTAKSANTKTNEALKKMLELVFIGVNPCKIYGEWSQFIFSTTVKLISGCRDQVARDRSATFKVLEPVRKGLNFDIQRTKRSGMAFLAQFNRRCPLMKLGE